MTAAVNVAQGGSNNLTMRNRIINGAMMIDQRNAGASVTPANGAYTLDRFFFTLTQASKLTCQQNAGSVTPPVGFKNYLGITSSSAYSVLTGDTFLLGQAIEGFNTADLGWGTANAQTVTLSFQVRSSLTGTFGGVLGNSDGTRSYPFSYSVPVANTWTQISVTVAGDTSGTWLTNNSVGVLVRFGLGSGATYSGASGAWASANLVQPTGTVSLVGTSGATFYITGVQLEAGTAATPFEYRLYGTELSLCQRYYWRNTGTDPYTVFAVGAAASTVAATVFAQPPVPMRATPSVSLSNCQVLSGGTAGTATISNSRSGPLSWTAEISGTGFTANAGSLLRGNNNSAAYIDASSEL